MSSRRPQSGYCVIILLVRNGTDTSCGFMPPASAASNSILTSCQPLLVKSAILSEKSVMTATTTHNNNSNNKPAASPTRISSRRRSASMSPSPGEPSPEASPTLASPVAATKRPLQTSFAKKDVEVTPPNGADTHDNECEEEEEEEDAAAAAAAAAASLITSVKKRRRTRGTYPTLRLHAHTHTRSFSHSLTHSLTHSHNNLPRLCHRLISSQVGAADHLRGQRRHRAVNTHGRRRAAAL